MSQERFDTMANALRVAGIVSGPTETDRFQIIADIRRWMTKLVMGETVPARYLSNVLTETQRKYVVDKMRTQGLVGGKHGIYGGAVATPKLIEMAREDVTDEWIAQLVWGDAKSPAPEEPAPESEPEPVPRPPKPDWAPIPKTQTARDAALVQHIRTWLTAAADGERVYAARMTNIVGDGGRSNIARRLRDAGLVEVCGQGGNRWYEGVQPAVEQVREMTDEQLAVFLWPHRVGVVDAPIAMHDAPESDGEIEAAVDHTTGNELLLLLVQRMGEFLQVLEHISGQLGALDRIDRRIGRLEKELGLPEIGPAPTSNSQPADTSGEPG